VGPLLMLVKPYKQYVCGAFFISGAERGAENCGYFVTYFPKYVSSEHLLIIIFIL